MSQRNIPKLRTTWVRRFIFEKQWVVMRFVSSGLIRPQIIVGYHTQLSIANAKTLVELAKLADLVDGIAITDDWEIPMEIEIVDPAIEYLKSSEDWVFKDGDCPFE